MKNVEFLEFGDILMLLKLRIMDFIALQHRGQEGTGIAVSDGESVKVVKGEGLVTEIYTSEAMKELKLELLRLAMFAMQQQGEVDMKMSSPLFSFSNWKSCTCS